MELIQALQSLLVHIEGFNFSFDAVGKNARKEPFQVGQLLETSLNSVSQFSMGNQICNCILSLINLLFCSKWTHHPTSQHPLAKGSSCSLT